MAEEMVRDNPKRLTLEWHKAERGTKIFVDVNRNAYAQHAVSPYGVRAAAAGAGGHAGALGGAVGSRAQARPLDGEDDRRPRGQRGRPVEGHVAPRTQAACLTSTAAMAVVIASDLGKDIAGKPLLSGVSFKLERRDRMTLSGRNGSGKTTLLRMLAGDASVDRGQLSLRKGVKVALHDQRPPRERDLSLRDYVLSGAGDIIALEQRLTRLEQAMADGAHDERTLNAYSKAQERFELHGGYRWRDRCAGDPARPGLPRGLAGPPAGHLLRRRAHARIARAGAHRPARPAAARRAHQPPRHRLAGVAGGAPGWARRRGDPGGPRPLVPRGGGHVGARAGGRDARASSRAPGTRGARSRQRASWRWAARSSASRRRSSGWSAS